MTNLTIEIPDELARRLETIASSAHKSLEQLAMDHLKLLAEYCPGSPSAVLRATVDPPHLTPAEVDDLDAAIASARLSPAIPDPFSPNIL